MTQLEKYYNKFNEEHRLGTRHGQVEFLTTLKFIRSHIQEGQKITLLDLGAGTGRYSVEFAREGHNVTAVELVPRNLKAIEDKHENINCWPGDARDLHFLPDGKFDITLVFGPLYHLHTDQDKVQVLKEARRVTKKGGLIFVAYVMNEYSILQYCFGEGKILECEEKGQITEDFHTVDSENELYSYVRLEDIDRIRQKAGMERVQIFAADGPSDYMRPRLNAMSDQEFQKFIEYHWATCLRPELLGASSHLVDVLKN